ncbi:hypothetical protein CASFOL_031464 [Castilleja foliolosa]|uniref:Uncharacterized protein n=1 Tax=Castilleja foliolosa TaxID=1961234 RepID=A0ABD3C624_9LAMI
MTVAKHISGKTHFKRTFLRNPNDHNKQVKKMAFEFDKYFAKLSLQQMVGKKNLTGKYFQCSCEISVLNNDEFETLGSSISDYLSFDHSNIGRFFGPFCGDPPEYVLIGFEKTPIPLFQLPSVFFKQFKGVSYEFLPVFEDTHQNIYQMAYVQEFQDFIDMLGSEKIPEATYLINHPIMWSSERRIDFLQDVHEHCNTSVDDKLLKLIKVVNLEPEVGHIWSYIHYSVCKDLSLSTKSLPDSYAYFRVHVAPKADKVATPPLPVKGIHEYHKLDQDFVKGLDLYLSLTTPSFFMAVYHATVTAMVDETTSRVTKECFLKYIDCSFDIGDVGSGPDIK